MERGKYSAGQQGAETANETGRGDSKRKIELQEGDMTGAGSAGHSFGSWGRRLLER